ncbi:MAG: hypothetical protein CSA22_02270 [Deltaproteobacteria bacterium]|nr:MAG: hypothetical protein CSA22_02270 [Deltaproteobacteria bacterium]
MTNPTDSGNEYASSIMDNWMQMSTSFWDSINSLCPDAEKRADAQAEFQRTVHDRVKKFIDETLKSMQPLMGNLTPEITQAFLNEQESADGFIRMMKAGWNSCSDFQKQMLASAGSIGDVFGGGSGAFDAEVFRSLSKIYEKEIQKFLVVPPVGLARMYQEKVSQTFDKFNMFQVTFLEFLYLLYMPIEKTSKMMQDGLVKMAEDGELPDQYKDYYQMWVKKLEQNYMNLFQSVEYTRTLVKTLESLGDYMAARKEITQDLMKMSGITVERDMDELNRDLYELKKMVKSQQKEIRELKKMIHSDRPQ